MKRLCLAALGVGIAGSAGAIVFPTTGHVAMNFIPFGAGVAGGIPTMHQVFASTLFSAQTGGQDALIASIAFAPGVDGAFSLGQVTINLGYTNAIPGVASGAGGLVIPTQGGGGNNVGAMTTFYSNPVNNFNFVGQGSNNFQMSFAGTPFLYDPDIGNLLVEIIVPSTTNLLLTVSRSGGSAESSRAIAGTRFGDQEMPTQAARMDFQFTAVPEPGTFVAIGAGLALLALRRFKK